MFQAPVLLLSALLASTYGIAYHLWKGKGFGDLLAYWLAATIGFFSGQLAGYLLEIVPWSLGEVHIVEGTLIAILFLVLARWLRKEKASS